ncbi:hypothetical protein MTO96_001845 [Rhipicephalus appendiculatus]
MFSARNKTHLQRVLAPFTAVRLEDHADTKFVPDIDPKECLGSGWTTAISKRKSQSQPGVSDRLVRHNAAADVAGPAPLPPASSRNASPRPPGSPSYRGSTLVSSSALGVGWTYVKRISQIKVTQALAMAAQLAPAETEEDIVCGNLVQNIFVVSTPTEKNARAYARVEALLVGTARYEVNSYLAAPDNTCKGIVRGVGLDFDHNQLRDMIVQPRNPKAL